MKRSTLAAILLGSIGLCTMHHTAQAHGAWLAQIHGDYHVMWGHDPSKTGPYNPADIVEARSIKNGQVQALAITRAEKYATMQAGEAGMVGATMDSGFSTRTTDGKYHRLAKAEAAKLGEIKSSAYRKRYMVVYANNREEPKRMGYDLELLPQFNPSKAKKGEQVPVQVFYKGKPLANAEINDNFLGYPQQSIKTDSQGKATLTVANYGHNAWVVSHSEPYPDPQKADTFSYSTVVTFFAPAPGAH